MHTIDTIGSVDDAIEKNEEIIDKLLKYVRIIYKNYTNNTSDADSKKLKLGDCTNIVTGKLNANMSSPNGKYKFFTCSQNDSYIDNYSFDCEAIILSGNGDICVKYYKGKFDAYQRTYVLCPKEFFFLFYMELEEQIDNLKKSSQGSVIKFITKEMIEKIQINIFACAESYNNRISTIFNTILNIKNRNSILKEVKEKFLKKYFD